MLTAVSISPTCFTEYRRYTIESLANELARARDLDNEQARVSAERSFNSLFPEEHPSAKDQFIFELVNNNETVGVLHFGIRRDANTPYVYLWDILIYHRFRGRGFGREAMKIMETKSTELGFKRIMLHVFGSNRVARNLYESLGYTISSLWMERKIE